MAKIHFRHGSIIAWKEYSIWDRIKAALTFKKLDYNRYYIVLAGRRIPYIKHAVVYYPVKKLDEDTRRRFTTIFKGKYQLIENIDEFKLAIKGALVLPKIPANINDIQGYNKLMQW